MIENYENGVRKVTLGEGTSFISQILVDGSEMSSGILFSNKPPVNAEFHGDEVIIEITNFQGAMSYMKAVVELLKTWKIEGLDKQFDDLSNSLEMLTKK